MEIRYLVLAVVAAIAVALVVFGMAASLRRRRRTQGGLETAFVPVPDALGEPLLVEPVLHVATTRAGDPYERIAAGGLGFRAHGTASVHPEGVVLSLDGLRSLAGSTGRFLPRSSLRGAGRATWTLDRVVERDGLVLVGWTLGGDDVDTYLRAERPEALVAALLRLIPEPAPSDQETP